MKQGCIVIPCYNEFDRFDVESFEFFCKQSNNIFFYLVNDGSKDSTLSLLNQISKKFQNVSVINLEINKGKAEAVRTGILCAYKTGKFSFIGFWDADFSVSLKELLRLRKKFMDNYVFVFGSKIKKLDATIIRKKYRYYLGRLFAMVISTMFKIEAYDTQCGAKIFHKDIIPFLFDEPFQSRWFFDVELFIRLKKKFNSEWLKTNCFELPVNSCIDKGGSKFKFKDFLMAPVEIFKLYLKYR